jgi:hypothetical protein
MNIPEVGDARNRKQRNPRAEKYVHTCFTGLSKRGTESKMIDLYSDLSFE